MDRLNFRRTMARILCILMIVVYVFPSMAIGNPDQVLASGETGVWEEVDLVNGSFEDEPTSTNVGINGWRYHPSLYQRGAALSAEQAEDGAKSVMFNGEKSMGIETALIEVKPGGTYKLTYAVNPTSITGAPSVWFRWFSDANGATQHSFTSNPLPADLQTGTWTTVTAQVTVPENIGTARILIVSSSVTMFNGYFDNFKLYEYVENTEPTEPEDPEEPQEPQEPEEPTDPDDPEDPAPPEWEPVNVPNAGFEEEPVDGTLGISSWEYLVTGYTKGASLSTEESIEGEQSVYFSGEKNMGIETLPFSIDGGENYKATVQAKVSSISGDVRVWLRWHKDGDPLSDSYLTVPGASLAPDEWTEITINATAPAEATHASVLIYASSNTSIVGFFDDLRVSKYAPPVDEDDPKRLTVINGGFEDSPSGTAIPGWSFWSSGNKTGVVVSQERAFEGKQSLKVTEITATGLQSTLIPVTPGQQYKASSQIYLDALVGDPGIWIRWYTSNNTLIPNSDSAVYKKDAILGEWHPMEVIGRAPSNAAYAMIFLYATGNSKISGYIDDVRFYHQYDPNELELAYNYSGPFDLGDATLAADTSGVAIGNGEIYFATNGAPSTFYAISIATGEVIYSQSLPGVNTAWAITVASDNNVYFGGTTNGNLYRYDRQTRAVSSLGANPAGEFIWDLDASSDGKLYGGTYPTGEMFEYDIASGAFKNFGVLKEGQQYVRGTGVSGDYAYGGTGSTAYLYRINRQDGTKEEIEMPITGVETMVSNIWKHNDLLFVAYGTSLLIIDEETGELLQQMDWQAPVAFDGALSQPSPLQQELVYFRNKNTSELYTYNTSTDAIAPVEPRVVLPAESLKTMSWVRLSSGEKAGRPVLVMVTTTGRYSVYDPEDHSLVQMSPQIAVQGVYVNSMETGPDGKLYIGGYMGSYSIYDPATGTYTVQETDMQQTEGIGFYNGKVYFGTYGSAMIYRYDPNQPLNFGNTPANNPGLVQDIGDDQDRPFVFETGGGKMFIGTFPSYGKLGGALTVYDEAEDSWLTYRNVVENQSIYGMAYRDGLLYAGTSVSGGLGIDPSESEAKMFIWNTETAEKIKEFVPEVPGIVAPQLIGDLTFDNNGLLWGGIAGLDESGQVVKGIFAYDPASEAVVKSKILIENAEIGSMFRPYYLRWENGLLYTTIGSQLTVVDPVTVKHKKLLDQTVHLMTIGHDGSIYYVYGSKIFKRSVDLKSVQFSSAQQSLKVGQETSLQIEGTLINDRDAYVYSGDIVYSSSDNAVAAIENGVLKAVGAGSAEIWASVTLDGVTKVTNRIQLTVTEAEVPDDSEPPSVPDSSTGTGSGVTPVDSWIINEQETTWEDGLVERTLIIQNDKLPLQEDENYELHAPDNTDIVAVQMKASLMKQLAERNAGLTLILNETSLTLPASMLELDAISEEWNAASEDIVLEIRIAPASSDQLDKTKAFISDKGYEMVGTPMVFEIVATYNEASISIDTFTGFVERTMSMPDDVDENASITAVVVDEDGSLRHVPTKLQFVDGQWIAVVKSMTNSIYALIEHEAAFLDTAGHWAKEFIANLGARTIITGRTYQMFVPEDQVNRAEFAAMLVRGLGLKLDSSPSPFTDVKEQDWYADTVNTAYQYGLIEGFENETFLPQANITREQAMTITARIMQLAGRSLDDSDASIAEFADRDRVSSWALENVQAALNAGIVQGRTADELAPSAYMTRAEAAVMIQRLLQALDLI